MAGLITVEKGKRGAFWLEVTDRGWRWAEEHLSDPLPDKSFGGAFVLRAWLSRLQAFMQARNIGLAEVLATPASDMSPDAVEQPRPIEVLDYRTLRERIRNAYLAITGGSFNTRARLSEIRERLPDIDRRTLDDTLKRMQSEEDASLMQFDNRVEITDADHDAALQIGSEPRHILWISR